mgnify:CR=1 FL=1
MQKNKTVLLKTIGFFICISLFASIRLFENTLFYDPLIGFFKTDFNNSFLPKLDLIKLTFSNSLRYLLNTVVSIALLGIVFKDIEIIKISLLLYIVLYIILIFLTLVVLTFFAEKHMLLFYIRRFLIQPFFILLLIPGFYFQKLTSS